MNKIPLSVDKWLYYDEQDKMHKLQAKYNNISADLLIENVLEHVIGKKKKLKITVCNDKEHVFTIVNKKGFFELTCDNAVFINNSYLDVVQFAMTHICIRNIVSESKEYIIEFPILEREKRHYDYFCVNEGGYDRQKN